MQFWPPDDEHMCSKHVEAWNKLIVKQNFCASSWLITKINLTNCVGIVGCSYVSQLNRSTVLTSYAQFVCCATTALSDGTVTLRLQRVTLTATKHLNGGH